MQGTPRDKVPLPLCISPEALRYISDNGGEVMIRLSPRNGCCGGTAWLPVIDLGRPRQAESYKAIHYDGVVVHVDQEIVRSMDTRLRIGVDGMWRWRKLWVEGASSQL